MRRTNTHHARRACAALPAQFHWLFYSTRTLPNTFASLLVTWAVGCWIDGAVRPAIRLLTIATVICRAELVLLLGPLALTCLVNRQVGFVELISLGLPTAAAALAVSVCVDSVFWRRMLYPEGEVPLRGRNRTRALFIMQRP